MYVSLTPPLVRSHVFLATAGRLIISHCTLVKAQPCRHRNVILPGANKYPCLAIPVLHTIRPRVLVKLFYLSSGRYGRLSTVSPGGSCVALSSYSRACVAVLVGFLAFVRFPPVVAFLPGLPWGCLGCPVFVAGLLVPCLGSLLPLPC